MNLVKNEGKMEEYDEINTKLNSRWKKAPQNNI
jgi:hypothetical protein